MVVLEKRSFKEVSPSMGSFSFTCHGLVSGEGNASSLNEATKKAEEDLIKKCGKGINMVFDVKYQPLRGSPNFKVMTYGEGYKIGEQSFDHFF